MSIECGVDAGPARASGKQGPAARPGISFGSRAPFRERRIKLSLPKENSILPRTSGKWMTLLLVQRKRHDFNRLIPFESDAARSAKFPLGRVQRQSPW